MIKSDIRNNIKNNIKNNVEEIQAKIVSAAQKSGRNPKNIKLVGVTKNIELTRVQELVEAGVEILGENRVQEFLPKYDVFPSTLWHFIGHLQSNKVKFIVDKVDLIHSVDSLSLAQEINRHATKNNITVNILAEINIANEDSKFGFKPEEIFNFVESLQTMPQISLKGLMCVAPFVENAEENRPHFTNMRKLLLDIQEKYQYHHICELSMGMSGDFEIAIEEGSTMIRIGTLLFR